MKLSISNIAWDNIYDEEMYGFLAANNFDGIEIAPTRFAIDPYNNIEMSVNMANHLKGKYKLDISSLQSIWFGRTENIFETEEERSQLISYTQKVVNYAKAIHCKNIVFGCPKNRNINDISKYNLAYDFFLSIGELAFNQGVTIALEPNPTIYNTNFLNTTREAISFLKQINSPGLKLNVDLGTIIWNKEDFIDIINNIELVNHIHISEPYLEQIEKRNLHNNLSKILKVSNYDNYISIEMKNVHNIELVKNITKYVLEVFR